MGEVMNEMALTVDAEGYLVDPSDWNDEVARELARREAVSLDEHHWAVLRFMRDFFEEHQVAPDVRHVTKHMSETKGIGTSDAKTLLFAMFPYGYVKQACKIAGMRKPRGWSTG